MKKNIKSQFGFFLLLFFAAYRVTGQCSFTGLNAKYCVNSQTVGLTLTNPGGTLSGPGISGTVFNPQTAGIGTHTILYTTCTGNYSLTPGVYAPINIAGNSLAMGDDDVSNALPIGFSFKFFCNTYTDFYIGSNGFMTFSSGQADGCCQGDFLPNGSDPANLIAFAWADLYPPAGGTIQYAYTGVSPNRKLLMTFSGIAHYSSGNLITTQVQLHETTNIIQIHTTTMPTDGNYHTMGIEDVTATNAFAVTGRNSNNTWSATNEMWQFAPADCISLKTTTVYAQPTLSIAGSNTACANTLITLVASGAATYTWNTLATTQVLSAFQPYTTTYTVTGTDANSCVNSSTKTVISYALPIVTISSPTTALCMGTSINLSASGALTYTWSTNSTNSGITVSPTVSGTFSVNGNNMNGCTSSASLTLIVVPLPALQIVVTPSLLCEGETTKLTASGAITYTWNTGPNTSFITESPTVTTDYTVSGTNGNGCNNSAVITQSVTHCTGIGEAMSGAPPLKIYPNPNNGSFFILADVELNLTIVNELGQIVKTFLVIPGSIQQVLVNELGSGVYFAVARNHDQLFRQKIIISK